MAWSCLWRLAGNRSGATGKVGSDSGAGASHISSRLELPPLKIIPLPPFLCHSSGFPEPVESSKGMEARECEERVRLQRVHSTFLHGSNWRSICPPNVENSVTQPLTRSSRGAIQSGMVCSIKVAKAFRNRLMRLPTMPLPSFRPRSRMQISATKGGDERDRGYTLAGKSGWMT